MHSTVSDGSWGPEAVVHGAAEGGLDVIALTDHDTAAGFEAAEAIGRDLNVQVISGIEVSSTFQGRDVHVLGYFIDPRAASIIDHGERARRRREERMREMVGRLASSGIDVTFDRYPYVAYSTGLTSLFPVWSRDGRSTCRAG